MGNYLISISNIETIKDGTIHDPASKLKVKAFEPQKSLLAPVRGEVRYFVTATGAILAFETKGYKKHRQLLILQMISRYCQYLGIVEAQIHAALPV
jgi:hypothetical protein